MIKIYLQLFAKGSTTNSTSATSSQSGSHTGVEGGSSTSTVGGSTTDTTSSTVGGSTSTTNSASHAQTNTNTQGFSATHQQGKTWASGQVEEKTQQMRDKYNVDYVQSDNVTNAYNALQEALSGKPTFQSQYEDKLNDMYNNLMNKDPFTYNFNEDEMYQLYKDQYITNAKRGMEDTMGYASALNGGYGSSYAQSAAQQTYQNYLNDLNSMIPTLRDEAYQEWKDRQSDELQKYQLTNDAYNREYGQYRDSMSDWQADRSFAQGMYQDERNFDYNKFAAERNYWNSEYWNEKNAEQSTMSDALTNYAEQSQSVTDTQSTSTTDTSYWENSASHSENNYWENSNTSYWSNTDSSAWDNSFTQASSTSMPMGGSGGSGSSGSARTTASASQSGTHYQGWSNQDVANNNTELVARYGGALPGMSEGETADTFHRIQTMDATKVEDYVFDLLDDFEVSLGKTAYKDVRKQLLDMLAERTRDDEYVTGEDIAERRKAANKNKK